MSHASPLHAMVPTAQADEPHRNYLAPIDDLVEGYLGPDTHSHLVLSNGAFDGLCLGCEARIDLAIDAWDWLERFIHGPGGVDLELLMDESASAIQRERTTTFGQEPSPDLSF